MAIKKISWSKPSRYSRGLKYQIRFDNRLKKFIIVSGRKHVFTDNSFSNPQDAREFILGQ
jgi:hypothetical protein